MRDVFGKMLRWLTAPIERVAIQHDKPAQPPQPPGPAPDAAPPPSAAPSEPASRTPVDEPGAAKAAAAPSAADATAATTLDVANAPDREIEAAAATPDAGEQHDDQEVEPEVAASAPEVVEPEQEDKIPKPACGPPQPEEIERRRQLVRALFNDFWSGRFDKPAAFVDRLNEAESYLNERLAASGEVWQLDAGTRKLLGLPPRSNSRDHAHR